MVAGVILAPLIGVATWSAGATSPALALTAGTSAGCSTTSPRTTTLSLAIGGFNRTVIVHRPKGLTANPLPLVLNLHGSGSTAVEQEAFTGMNTTANAEGFIVAYPQALIPDGQGFDWNVPHQFLIGGRSVPAKSANDISFLTTLVMRLEDRYCVDPQRVYATGFSGGAREVSALACADSTTFAAVAPVSGLRHPSPCPTTRAVPVITFHGSVDPVDPFGGHGQKYWTYSVPSAAKDWAKQDHCSAVSEHMVSSHVRLTSFTHCANDAQVDLYEIIGEGHEWPGGKKLPAAFTAYLGPQSSAIDADAAMWSFFSRYTS